MALSKKEYLESLLQLLSIIKAKHDFKQPIDQKTRVRLAAFANTAVQMGFPKVDTYLHRALTTNDPKAQEIILISGISAGDISKKSIKPVIDITADRFTTSGGDAEKVMADAVASTQPTVDAAAEEEMIDLDALDLSDEEVPEDIAPEEGDMPEDEPVEDAPEDAPDEDLEGDTGEDMGDEEPPPEDDEEKPDKDGDRVAKEGDEEEEYEPGPLNDWVFNHLRVR